MPVAPGGSINNNQISTAQPSFIKLISSPAAINFSRNPIPLRLFVKPYGPNEIQTNSRFLITVKAESTQYADDFKDLKQFELYPNQMGVAEADLSSLLDAQLSFYVPDIQSPKISEASTQAIRFKIKIDFVSDYEQLSTLNSDTYHVIKGGLAKESAFTKTYFSQYEILKLPLRFPDPVPETTTDIPQFMYFLGRQTVGPNESCDVQYVINYTDNTSTTVTVAMNGVRISKYMLMCLPSGYINGGIKGIADPTKTVSNYQIVVRMETTTGNMSPAIRATYLINYRNYYNAKTLLFHNSLGGLDTIVMRGTIEASAEYEKQEINIVNAKMFSSRNVIANENRYYNSKEREAMSGETGFYSKERIEQLRDLLNSGIAYESIGNKRLIPIAIEGKTVKMYSNKDQLFSIAINWKEAFSDSNFSPLAWLEEPTSCPSVELLSIIQLGGNEATVIYQLPDGYFNAELVYGGTNSVTSTNNFTIPVTGNSGTLTVDVSNIIPQSSTNSNGTVYFWMRVVCRDYNPTSYGSWLASGPITLSNYAPIILPNMYSTTYKGAGVRRLYYLNGSDNILSLMTNPNTGSWVVTAASSTGLVTATGNQGGSFSFITNSNPTIGSKIDYTPVNASFEGIEVLQFRTNATNGGNALSPSYAKLFVTIQGVNNGTATNNIGSIYIKLVVVNSPTTTISQGTFGGQLYVTKKPVFVYFYSDPLGATPIDLTGQLINFSIASTLVSGGSGSPVVSTFTATGQSMNLGMFETKREQTSYTNTNGSFTPGYIFVFEQTLNTSSQYFIL